MKNHRFARQDSARRRTKAGQYGQSAIEYIVVCAALAAALFFPITDASSPDGPRTTVQLVLDGFQAGYRNFSYAISLP